MSKTSFAKEHLKSFVDRIERLEEEKKTIAGDIKEVYAEAKGNGFDTKVLRKVIALRRKDQAERQEEEAMLDVYLAALGMQPSLFDEPEPRPGARPLPRDGAADGEGTQPVSVAPSAAMILPAMVTPAGQRGALTDETADEVHGGPPEGKGHSVKSAGAAQTNQEPQPVPVPLEQAAQAAGEPDGPVSGNDPAAASFPDMPEFLERRKRPLTAADFLGAG